MYRDPKPEELDLPEFNAIWECIKKWDIGRPEDFNSEMGIQLYSGTTGNHVVCILDALREAGFLKEKILIETLSLISSTSLDKLPPFRNAPAEALASYAREALEKYQNDIKRDS